MDTFSLFACVPGEEVVTGGWICQPEPHQVEPVAAPSVAVPVLGADAGQRNSVEQVVTATATKEWTGGYSYSGFQTDASSVLTNTTSTSTAPHTSSVHTADHTTTDNSHFVRPLPPDSLRTVVSGRQLKMRENLIWKINALVPPSSESDMTTYATGTTTSRQTEGPVLYHSPDMPFSSHQPSPMQDGSQQWGVVNGGRRPRGRCRIAGGDTRRGRPRGRRPAHMAFRETSPTSVKNGDWRESADKILSPSVRDRLRQHHQQHNQQEQEQSGVHPLYVAGVCAWFNCKLSFSSCNEFMSHLRSSHKFGDSSFAHASMQMDIVRRLRHLADFEAWRLVTMMRYLEQIMPGVNDPDPARHPQPQATKTDHHNDHHHHHHHAASSTAVSSAAAGDVSTATATAPDYRNSVTQTDPVSSDSDSESDEDHEDLPTNSCPQAISEPPPAPLPPPVSEPPAVSKPDTAVTVSQLPEKVIASAVQLESSDFELDDHLLDSLARACGYGLTSDHTDPPVRSSDTAQSGWAGVSPPKKATFPPADQHAKDDNDSSGRSVTTWSAYCTPTSPPILSCQDASSPIVTSAGSPDQLVARAASPTKRGCPLDEVEPVEGNAAKRAKVTSTRSRRPPAMRPPRLGRQFQTSQEIPATCLDPQIGSSCADNPSSVPLGPPSATRAPTPLPASAATPATTADELVCPFDFIIQSSLTNRDQSMPWFSSE